MSPLKRGEKRGGPQHPEVGAAAVGASTDARKFLRGLDEEGATADLVAGRAAAADDAALALAEALTGAFSSVPAAAAREAIGMGATPAEAGTDRSPVLALSAPASRPARGLDADAGTEEGGAFTAEEGTDEAVTAGAGAGASVDAPMRASALTAEGGTAGATLLESAEEEEEEADPAAESLAA